MTDIKITDDELALETALRNEEESCWKLARMFAGEVGHAPPLFSSCIRAINKADSILDALDKESVRQVTVSATEFLVKVSPTLKAIFYFAAESFHPDRLDDAGPLSVKKLISIFEPREVASIIGLSYVYKRIEKKSDPKVWDTFQRKIHTQMEIGFLLGDKMRNIGRGNGLLLGAVRLLSQATFAIKAPKEFREFSKHMRTSRTLFDINLETNLFECNHLQIASLLVQDLGFCMPRSPISMSLGMDSLNVQSNKIPRHLREQLLSWRAAMEYVEAYHTNGAPPESIDLDYSLKLPEAEEQELRDKIWIIIREGSQFDWIAKTRGDLPEEIAEELGAFPPRMNDAVDVAEGAEEDVPETIFDDGAF